MKYVALSVGLAAFLFVFKLVFPEPVKPDTSIHDLMNQWQAEYGAGWWPWGLQAIDLYGNGQMALVITQHNGGSRVLKQTDAGWTWTDVESSLGGTYRPYVMDFQNDGQSDLLYRDSLANTAFVNTGGKFTNAGFAYGTDNDPIKDITPTYFGTDFDRWNLPTFAHVNYTNPNFAKLPVEIQIKYWTEKAKWGKFFRGWFNEIGGIVTFTGFYSYHKDLPWTYYYKSRGNKLVDVGARFGLPAIGAIAHAQDFNGDGLSDLLITGQGYFTSGPNGYAYEPGALSDFLVQWPDWCHQVFVSGQRLVVSNVKGQQVKIFNHIGNGQFGLYQTYGSWNGEGVALGDFDGDGTEDIVVGSGNDVIFIWGNQ